MSKLRQYILMHKFNTSENESTAKRLMRLLKEDKDATHICYTSLYDIANNLVKIKKKKERKTKISTKP